MDDAGIHARVMKSLSEEGLLSVAREAALSFMGRQPQQLPPLSALSADVGKAVSALLVLTRALNQGDAAFDAALRSGRLAWVNLGEPLELTGGLTRHEYISAVMTYSDHLVWFRGLWSLLFRSVCPSASSSEVPPHIFAVSWSEVRCANNMEWIRAAQSAAQKTLVAIESGNAPCLMYFLFILQKALAVRVILLECISGMIENSTTCVDIMNVVRYMYTAYEAQQEMTELQAVWERAGLFSDAQTANCVRQDCHDDKMCGDLSDRRGADAALRFCTGPKRLFPTCCPFLWILQRLVWSLYGGFSLLFRSCLLTLPFVRPHENTLQENEENEEEEEGEEDGGDKATHSEDSLQTMERIFSQNNSIMQKQQGRRGDFGNASSSAGDIASLRCTRVLTLAPSVSVDALTSSTKSRREVPSIVRGDSMQRLGGEEESLQVAFVVPQPPYYLSFADTPCSERELLDACGCHLLAEALWNATHERHGATLFVLTDCTHRPGRRAWQNNCYTMLASPDGTEVRQGLDHWVLNFVFPASRLSANAGLRAQQESALLCAVVFQALGSTARRLRFTNVGSVFHVVRSGSEMDGGRLYFVLLLHRDAASSHPLDGRRGDDEEESRWAFRSLEEVSAAWSLSHLCNLAVRLAAWGV
ncbi:hypothetical protein DQ04_02131100 [Trypanosoma grayi]|uniref:hypothetical protein n=1 Tax=Trypanosoma grayi TaxID=71804 RepID=UPI0004F40F41|nr:hypothetical protein DQ04_02131100 [Trypanosoma grayi]KEG11946.1 hypothetical protein DQ04_02131100 [Trypanosoma grayi]